MSQSPRADRSGECGGRPEGGHVVERAAGQVEVGLPWHADRAGHPLDLAEQRHEVVRGDGRGGVVRGPVGVSDLEPVAAEVGDDELGDRFAGHGEPTTARQARGAGCGIGERHERVDRGAPRVGCERVESERAGQVGDHGSIVGFDGGGHLRDRGIRRGDHEEVDPVRRAGHVVAPADRLIDRPPGPRQREAQPTSRPAGPDHPQPGRNRHG